MPAQSSGKITFGSFNNLAKVTPGVIEQWALLLNSLPKSRMLIKEKALSDPKVCSGLIRRFSQYGVDPGRIELVGWTPTLVEHLKYYKNVDIALDTFPYNGTTTTCEALWMGVPVIALEGKAHAGRIGMSILSRIGYDDLVAGSKERYVQIAKDLATDPARLSEMRGSLRGAMKAAPLTDCKARAADIEKAYRSMWKTWCESVA